ncbi:MAG: ADP-ribosylglycohydrolase family protein [Mycobacterium leprae]
MDWQKQFLEALKASRGDWDEEPDWRAALALYQGLGPAEAAELDQTVLNMVDEDYRNPHSGRGDLPFDDVMVNLPAGMAPDDLLCIEGAVMVAAERGLGEALFAVNRLMRSQRWHAMYPRLVWLSREGFEAQRKLAATRAGRYVGALLGLACGDALGATVEFMDRAQVRLQYPDGLREIVGGGPWSVKPGEWTDDTAMALAVARGIAENPADPVEAVGRHFIAWFQCNPPDVGNTCRTALVTYLETGSWQSTEQLLIEKLGKWAGGNGALMRTIPTPLAYGRDLSQAIAIAHMTHPHVESDAAVAVYHLAVEAALRGEPKQNVLAAGLSAAGPLTERLAHLAHLRESDLQSTGYVVDTLEAALWCFEQTDSLEECITAAVNLGDDADTVGAVAGGLAGAYYGVSAVPRRWSGKIAERLQLEAAAEQLLAVARQRL